MKLSHGWRKLLTAFLLCAVALMALGQEVMSDHAVTEGKVVVYGTTDQRLVAALVADFESQHPGVRVEYHDMNSSEIYQRFLEESAKGTSADVLWSSAMDLQVKLVNDGYAQHHQSAETAVMPNWAVWRNEAFGTTYEPIVIVYNKKRLPPEDVPATHKALIQLLKVNPSRFGGKVVTYDPRQSGLGYLLHTQDANTNGAIFWDLISTLGASQARVDTSTGAMMDKIATGEALIAYNLLGSYAHGLRHRDDSIGIVMPKDYTLVVSRVAFVARKAPHPHAAHLWLDYLLSRRGQQMIASTAELFAIREDVRGETTAAGLKAALGGALKPISIGPALLTYLDQAKRSNFLAQWESVLSNK